MITNKGLIFLFMSSLLLLLGLFLSSIALILLGFAILFFMIYLMADFIYTDFSNIEVGYSYPPFAYENDSICIRLNINLNKQFYFKLIPSYPSYLKIQGKVDTDLKLKSGKFSINAAFISEGRYKLPFPKIKVYSKHFFFQRKIPLKGDQMIFIKKNEPPYIKDNRQARANLNRIGSLKSKEGLGDHDFKQLREYTYGDDFRKIEWKSTARKGKLTVKESYSEEMNNFFVAVDVGKNMDVGKYRNILNISIFAAEAIIHILSQTNNRNGFSLFDNKVLSCETHISNQNILDKYHNSLIKITAANNTDYNSVFSKIGKTLKKRAIVILISNLQEKIDDTFKALRNLPTSKHRICILYPFEPYFEKHSEYDLIEQLIFDSLSVKYEKDFLALQNKMKKKNIKLLRFGPSDYETQIVNLFRLIGKREL